MNDRHLRIQNLVDARDHISARELANMLHVSVVTMRYIFTLIRYLALPRPGVSSLNFP